MCALLSISDRPTIIRNLFLEVKYELTVDYFFIIISEELLHFFMFEQKRDAIIVLLSCLDD